MVVLKDGGRDRENVTEPTNSIFNLGGGKDESFQICEMLSPSISPDMSLKASSGSHVTLGAGVIQSVKSMGAVALGQKGL